ncbi:MAG: flagellin [Fibromonadales bacterium]|nr:flagellin [Fibromonadales bacterium]
MPNTLFNVSSMMYQNKLRMHNEVLQRATERLATGSRINNAKDDPFRNYEAENARSEIKNAEKAKQNSADGAALLQVAEGTCGEVQSILQRVRELAVQAANDTLSSTERRYLNEEVGGLLNEIDRITAVTTFNTKTIFGNEGDSFSKSDVNTAGGRELKDWAKNPYMRAEGIRAGVLHVGPEANPGTLYDANQVRVSIPELSSRTLFGPDDPNGRPAIDLSDNAGATSAIDKLDSAINSLGTVRSYMGSLVNRMDRQYEDIESRNITRNDHVSKIKDTDFAKESTELMSAQIKQQAAISILAQSNSKIGRVLEILGG